MALLQHLGKLAISDIVNHSQKLCKHIQSNAFSNMCKQTILSQKDVLFQNINSTSSIIRLFHLNSARCAGHSKWHNIKHIKAANDKLKSDRSNFLARKLQVLFMKNPERDPKLNSELANLIKWARSNNLTNDVIDNAIDRQIKLRDPKNLVVFDGKGVSQSAILIECFSLKPHHSKSLLQGIVKKYGFNLNSPALDLFDNKGIVEVELSEEELKLVKSDPKLFPLEKYVDIAIEAEAEEVTLESGEDGPYLQFMCGPYDLGKVVKNLQSQNLTIANSERTYIPKDLVPVSQEFLNALEKLIEKLDLHPDVVNYYFNVKLES